MQGKIQFIESQAGKLGAQILLVDTAGRTSQDLEALEDLKTTQAMLKPKETLLVIDATTGQQAVKLAKVFQASVDISGLIITKLDSDAKGGAVLSAHYFLRVPIYFCGNWRETRQT